VIDFEGEAEVVIPTKKKKVKAKTVRVSNELSSAQMGANAIEAEDTLAMIKSALKSGNSVISEFKSLENDDAIIIAPKKKKVIRKKEKMPKLEENVTVAVMGTEEDKTAETLGEEDFQVSGDLESTDTANKRAGGKKPKKTKKTKKSKSKD